MKSFNNMSIEEIRASKIVGFSLSVRQPDGSYTDTRDLQEATAVHVHRNNAPQKTFSATLKAASKRLGTAFNQLRSDKDYALFVRNRNSIKTSQEFMAELGGTADDLPF